MEKIKFAVVGSGHIGKRHAEMVVGNPEAELIALVDIKNKEELGIEKYDVPFFSSMDELLDANLDIDVINICTPNGLHEEQSIKALEKGYHIVCEKPMALNKAGAEHVIFKALQVHKHVFAVMQNRYSPPSVWLKEIVDDCVLSLNNKLKQKSIKIDIDIDEQLRIDSEPGPFAQVISNFVMNSVIHGFEGLNTGVILIHASLTDSELIIDYTDDGKGMISENVKKVYEPFFTTKMGSGGSGLGMHVVYNIITQRFKGQINCKSTLGEGVSYNIIIPISAL